MKIARATHQDGSAPLVRLDGSEVGTTDSCRKILHLVPTLLLDARANSAFDVAAFRLDVISEFSDLLTPKCGIMVRRPCPNPRFVVAGSSTNRNGWTVGAENLPTEFEVEFRWTIFSGHPDFEGVDWVVRHRLSIKLLDGESRTYTMSVSNWPWKRDQPAPIYRAATAFVRQAQLTRDYTASRKIIIAGENLSVGGDEQPGVMIHEVFEIPPIPYEQATNIHAFQDKQLHELEHTAIFSRLKDEHLANASAVMPASTLLKAIRLAENIPYKYRPNIDGAVSEDFTGRLEKHPALAFLSHWWECNRPDSNSPFRVGMAMPFVRVVDDGMYVCGDVEQPGLPLGTMFSVRSSCASCGDVVLIHFMASVAHSVFEEDCLDIRSSDGELWQEAGVSRADVKNGLYDEALNCLDALAGFRSNFPVAFLEIQRLEALELVQQSNSAD
jgi:hypothetical protein